MDPDRAKRRRRKEWKKREKEKKLLRKKLRRLRSQVRRLKRKAAKNRDQEDGRAYEDAYRNGYYAGGNGIVDTVLPFDLVLPAVSIEQIVASGVEVWKPHGILLLNAGQIADELTGALNTGTPYSLVRLGDGELLALAQEHVLPMDRIRKDGRFLSSAGVNIPDPDTRDRLLAAVRQANAVGIPRLRKENFQLLAFSVFQTYGLDFRQLRLTHSLVNYYLCTEQRLGSILRGRQVLLIGNAAHDLAKILSEKGIQVSGIISPVQGVKDVERVISEAHSAAFDIALVSAGIAAVIIVQRIASELGKVAVDFGHLADSLAAGKEALI